MSAFICECPRSHSLFFLVLASLVGHVASCSEYAVDGFASFANLFNILSVSVRTVVCCYKTTRKVVTFRNDDHLGELQLPYGCLVHPSVMKCMYVS